MNNTASGWGLRTDAVPLASVLLVQGVLVALSLPIGELFSDQPLFYIDGAYHWLQLHVAGELARMGRLTGYDPYFAAGYLGGVTLNASAKIPALLAAALHPYLTEIQSYKLFVFLAAISGPAMVTLAARILRVGGAATWIATALGICFWWASAARWFHTAGMVSFVLACFAALPYFAGVARSLADGVTTAGRTVALGVTGALGLLLHPLFPIPVALLTTVFLAFSWRTLPPVRTIAFLTAVATLSLLPNLPWILAMARADDTVAGIVAYQTRVDIMSIPRELLGLWRADSMGSKINAGLLVATLVAAVGAADERRRFVLVAVVSWVLLALFAAVGAELPGAANAQPNRFVIAAYLFLTVPAGIGATVLWSWLRTGTWRRRAVALGLAAVCGGSFAYSTWEVAREVSYANVGHYGPLPPEIRPLGEKSTWLVSWLTANTTRDGRVLFETSKGRIHDQAHMAGYYALQSDREFVGGPYPYMFDAGFWDGFVFGKPIDTIPAQEFADDLDVYNIGWIVVHSGTSKKYLGALPNVELVTEHDDLSIYRAQRELSYFAVGSGRIPERGINRLVVDGLDGQEMVVLKYHYVKGLAADGPAQVEPVFLPGGDRPFVKLLPKGSSRVALSVR